MSGANTTRPKKPYTTEGIPANSSTTTFIPFFIRTGASSATYTATPKPKGKAISIAKKLTNKVPPIRGKAPNKGAGEEAGNHSRPPKTSEKLTLCEGSSFTEELKTGAYFSGR